MGGVSHSLSCLVQAPGSVQALEGCQFAANHLPSRVNDMLKASLCPWQWQQCTRW